MSAPERPFRFGLAGTGHWARITHAPALASTAGIELAGVWGRKAEAAAAVAGSYGGAWYDNFDDFLTGVDAVAFAGPPDVQAARAGRAAGAGRHRLVGAPHGPPRPRRHA